MTQYTKEYKDLVQHILHKGNHQVCRNGENLIIPHYSFTLDHSTGENYQMLLRKYFYKGVKGEFTTLMSDEPLTNVRQFEDNGCNYWKDWAGPKGQLVLDYYNEMHPAIENVIKQIQKDPGSRRHVISLWNNEHAFDGSLSLHSCWHNLTFSVIDGYLHLAWTQRSVDTMVGLPADIYLSYLFMQRVAGMCGLEVGSCMYSLSNVHIYNSHIDGARALLLRTEDDYDKPLKFELLA